MPRVVHFEISADDPERAIKFYSDVFGWQVRKWEGGNEDYWLVETGTEGPGINGGLFKRKGPIGHVNTVEVPSVDDAVDRIEAAGGVVVMPKQAIPTVGWFAYCHDTEGSVFGVMSHDPDAR